MKKLLLIYGYLSLLLVSSSPHLAFAKDYTTSTTAAGGYDVVAYFKEGKARRGSGNHVSKFRGQTYLFASEQNRIRFENSPQSFVPAFGGYCAYGVSVGKKFVGDPELWKIVNSKLYLNLNPEIQQKWSEDIPGNIVKAEEHWRSIEGKAPSEL